MTPSAFDYIRATSVGDALERLAEADGDAKLIAGGQSLGPMLNLRLARPAALIDIAGLPELLTVDENDDALEIGAGITAANIEDGRVPCDAVPMLPRIASDIAYRAVRNRSMIGGSLCHADPAADWVCTLLALGASCRIEQAGSEAHDVPLESFVLSAFENVLEDAALVSRIIIPRVSPGARFGYSKISWKVGKFALASAAVLRDTDRGIFCAVIGALDARPILFPQANEVITNGHDSGPEINRERVLQELTNNGVEEPVRQHRYLTALTRAAKEVFAK